MHDKNYEPSDEMRYSLAGTKKIEVEYLTKDDAYASEALTLRNISSLLDVKLMPLHESMSQLESKFQNLHIHVDNEISNLKEETNAKFIDMKEQLEIQDSNIDNMISQLREHETAILDIKEILATDLSGAVSSGIDSETASELKRMQDEISKLKRPEVLRKSFSDISLYHRQTCVIGGLQQFESRFEAEDFIRSKLHALQLPEPQKIETREESIGLLFCSMSSEEERDLVVQKMRTAEIDYHESVI